MPIASGYKIRITMVETYRLPWTTQAGESLRVEVDVTFEKTTTIDCSEQWLEAAIDKEIPKHPFSDPQCTVEDWTYDNGGLTFADQSDFELWMYRTIATRPIWTPAYRKDDVQIDWDEWQTSAHDEEG